MQESHLDTMENNRSTICIISDRKRPYWKKRSRLEKKLCVGVFLLVATLIGVIASFTWVYFTQEEVIRYVTVSDVMVTPATDQPIPITNTYDQPSPKMERQEFCTSTGCIQAAGEILQNMDSTKHPCIDFYEYACGGFKKENYIADDELEIGQFSKVIDKVSNQIKELLQEDVLPLDSTSTKLVKEFYISCMNETQVEKDGLKPVIDLLENIGGWPVLEGDDWIDYGFTWQTLMYKFKRANLSHNSFFDLKIVRDLESGNRHILNLGPPEHSAGLRFAQKGKKEHKRSSMYVDYDMILTARFYGADEWVAAKDWDDFVIFNQLLQEISGNITVQKTYIDDSKITTVAELQKISTEVNWTEYISTVLPYKINESEPIILTSIYYVNTLTKLLATTKPRTLANYAVGKIVHSLTLHISKEYNRMNYDLMKETPSRIARWWTCLEQINEYFGIAVGQLYIRRYFKSEAKQKATEMVNHLREAFNNMLTKVEWADPLTIKSAQEKLASIYPHVAFPDELLSDEKVNAVYETLTINRDNYFQNLRNIQAFKMYNDDAKLRKPVEKNSWKKSASVTEVNAYYQCQDNSITISAGILQEIFFSHDRPQYMNFAAIGSLVGHEVTHGFDSDGRQFDKDGLLKNWWEKETDINFRERAKCMVKQYDQMVSSHKGIQTYGQQTLDENIADNGGLKASYLAYGLWTGAKGNRELPLPGLNMTINQLFWITFANMWCSKQRKTEEKHLMKIDGHSLDRLRVNGPLANMKAFAKDFQCPLGSPMNPARKCVIW